MIGSVAKPLKFSSQIAIANIQINFASNQNIIPESFNLSNENTTGDTSDTDFERWSDFIRDALIHQTYYGFDGLKNEEIPIASTTNNEGFKDSLKKILSESSKKILISRVPATRTTQIPIPLSSIKPDVRSLGSELVTVSKIDKATGELLKGAFGNGFLAKMIEETVVGTIEKEVSKSLDKAAKKVLGYLEAKESLRKQMKLQKMVRCKCTRSNGSVTVHIVPENTCVQGAWFCR